MPSASSCPDRGHLQKLMLGRLLLPEAEELAKHLEGCDTCTRSAQTLMAQDTLVDAMRTQIAALDPAESKILTGLMDRLSGMAAVAGSSSDATRDIENTLPPAQPLTFQCAGCGKQLKAKADLAGKKVKCPKCGQVVGIPTANEPAKSHEPVDDGATLAPDPERAGAGPLTAAVSSPPSEFTEEVYDFLAPPQEPGEIGRLGPYRVLKVLGAGGMGVVFRAEDPRLERIVALKAMLPSLAASPSAKKRFLREAKTAASIKHDHIVTIYQVDEDRGAPYLAMEFLEGEPLDVRLKRGQVALAETLRIGEQIAEGLAAAHDNNLIHRDIKPANIWLESRVVGGGVVSGKKVAPTSHHSPLAPHLTPNRVKILDFGLARSTADQSGLTQSGAIMGTPSYMAPEQAQGTTVDHRCDLFSLGCVLYLMTTGQLPFKGNDTLSVLMALASVNPPPPHEVNSEVPEALSDLILQLLAKKPEDRPASAREAAESLRSIREADSGAATMTATAKRRVRPPTQKKRRPLVLAGVGLAALALVAGVVVFFLQTPNGILRVEIDDPQIEVSIKGTQIILKQADGGKDITLEPGEKTLIVGRGDFKFETDKLILKKGQTVTVKVSLLSGKVQVVHGGQVIGEHALAPAPTADLDRRIAESIVKRGGLVSVAADSKWLPHLKELKELPKAPFKVHGIHVPHSDFKLRDEDLQQFGSLRSLSHLILWFPGEITDAGIESFTRSPASSNIGHLQIGGNSHSKVTDAGLDHMKALAKLGHLNLKGAKVTAAGVKKLSASLPGCKIEWDGGTIEPRPASGATSTIVFSNTPISPAALVTRPATLPGVRSWTLETLAPRGGLGAPSHGHVACRQIALSPDGQLVAVAGADSTIRIWDLASGKLHKALVEHGGIVTELAWSPDGKWLGSCASDHIAIWDVDKARVVQRIQDVSTGTNFQPQPSRRLAWSPDGKQFASGWAQVWVRETASGRVLAVLPEPGMVLSLAFSQDGKTLALGGHYGGIALWDWRSQKLLRQWKSSFVSQIAWSPDGKTLASLSEGNVQMWDPETGARRPVDRKEWPSADIAWSPDGKLLATGRGDKVELCDPVSGKASHTLEGSGQGFLAWSRNGKTLAMVDGGASVVAWDVASKQVRLRRQPHPGCFGWSLSADGRLLAQFADRLLRLWDLATAKQRVGGPIGPFSFVTAFSPDGKMLTTGGEIVQADSLAKFAELPAAINYVHAAAWCPGNKRLARLQGETVEIWDVAARKVVVHTWKPKFKGQQNWWRLGWSPDGQTLAAAGPGSLSFWDVPAGKERQFKTEHASADQLAWSPDGKLLAIRDHPNHGRLGVWDTASGKELWLAPGTGMKWSPDGKSLTFVDGYGWLRTWQAGMPDPRVLTRVSSTDLGLFSANGLLASVYQHGQSASVRLWKSANGRPTGALVTLSQERHLAVSPDGHYRGSPGVVNELVYVVETEKGQETFTPEEFSKRYNWKNDLVRVQPLGTDVPDTLDVESAPPPPGATVLFAGKNLDAWKPGSGKIADGVLQVGEEPLVGKQDFAGRFRLHIEFRLPDKEAQGAVEVQGRCRVQLTNSLGQPLDARTSCGAIYTLAAPKADAARPVGTWQSLDFDFDSRVVDGKTAKPARLTVRLNGYPIFADLNFLGQLIGGAVELANPTPQAMFSSMAESGPMVLYGGDKGVQFRNVWLERLGE